MDELLELTHMVNDALGWLQDAEQTAGSMCYEEAGTTPEGQPIYKENGWKAMEEVCQRLASAREQLAVALDPVKDAIAEAQKHQDDGASEEDIHGFKYHPKA